MFVKVHEQIFNSSIMEEDLETRYIWFCMLTLADKEGFVDMTSAAIARRINVEERMVVNAINKFMQPDPSSRTTTCEGRRLEKIRESFGWKIINYIHYRDLRSEENRREYMRNYMRDKRDVNKKANTNVNSKQCKPSLANTDTDTDTDTDTKRTTLAATKTQKTGFDFSSSKFVNLTEHKISALIDKFPAVDIDKEIKKMEAWLMSNPKNRKSNYDRFICNWLMRCQDKSPRVEAQESVEDRHRREMEETLKRLGA